jgi:hypothetical protein
MRIAITVCFALALASPVAAQERFREVWVTQSDSGDIVRGRIVDLSGESLSILTPDNRRVDVPLARILRIEGQGDSLKNGAIIGAAVLGGLSLAACQGVSGGSQCATVMLFNTAFGGLMGAGLDALNGGRSTLYSRPAATSPGKTAGVGFRLRF